MKARLAFACACLTAILAIACSGRTSLRPTDAFIDDDPWLKTDAGRDARPDAGPRDASTDSRG
jgi:hypothetical protein